MLKITQAQVKMFEQHALLKFCQDAVIHFQGSFSAELNAQGNDEAQQTWIKAHILKSQSYGLQGKLDVYRYLHGVLLYGEKFDELPWSVEILNKKLLGATRAMLLEKEIDKQLDIALDEKKDEQDKLTEKLIEGFSHSKSDTIMVYAAFNNLPFDNVTDGVLWVKKIIRHAVSFGITDDAGLDIFLDAAMTIHDQFYTDPWADEIFNSGKSSAEKTLALIAHMDG